jgi:hypothetical protein
MAIISRPPTQQAFDLAGPIERLPKQVRVQRAVDRAKALGLKLKPLRQSQHFSLTSTKRAVVPVDYPPMTLSEVEQELTQLAKDQMNVC